MRWVRGAVLGVALLGFSLGVVVAVGSYHPTTEFYDFKNGYGLGTGNGTAFIQDLVICGDDAGTTTTNYLGPSLPSWKGDGTDYSLASAACSALDSTTEATADLAVSTLAMQALGMRCISDSTQAAGESLTMTLRSAAADTVPAITCVIGVAATECRSTTQGMAPIAAGATLAVKVVPSGNNAAGHVQCVVTLAL